MRPVSLETGLLVAFASWRMACAGAGGGLAERPIEGGADGSVDRFVMLSVGAGVAARCGVPGERRRSFVTFSMRRWDTPRNVSNTPFPSLATASKLGAARKSTR